MDYIVVLSLGQAGALITRCDGNCDHLPEERLLKTSLEKSGRAAGLREGFLEMLNRLEQRISVDALRNRSGLAENRAQNVQAQARAAQQLIERLL